MSQPNEHAIREQAYYLWEQDGRPMGRDAEYWQRAVILATPKAKMDSLAAGAPGKAKTKAQTKAPEPKAPVKVKAAATASKSEPAKSKPAAKKPKKK